MNNILKWEVKTELLPNGSLKQTTDSFFDDIDLSSRISTRISTQIFELQEESVRQALIKLGWTPPNEISTLSKRLLTDLNII